MQKALCVLKYFCCLKEILVQFSELQTEQKGFFSPMSSACHQFLLEKQFANCGYVDLGIFSSFSFFLEMGNVSLLLQGRLLSVFVDQI